MKKILGISAFYHDSAAALIMAIGHLMTALILTEGVVPLDEPFLDLLFFFFSVCVWCD